MLGILDLALNNNYIYFGIIGVLIIIIVITVLSLIKDRKKIKNNTKKNVVEHTIEPASSVEEKEHAKLELEKMVKQMENDIQNKPEKEIVTYEQEQEDKAIISYQELLEAAHKNNVQRKSMDVIPDVKPVDEMIEPEPLESDDKDKAFEQIINSFNSNQDDDVVEKNDIFNQNPIEDEYNFDEVKPVNVEETNDVDFTAPDSELSDEMDFEPANTKKEEPVNIDNSTKKFQTSEVISPVYGRQEVPDFGDNLFNERKSQRSNNEANRLSRMEKTNEPESIDIISETVINKPVENNISDETLGSNSFSSEDEFLDALKKFRSSL